VSTTTAARATRSATVVLIGITAVWGSTFFLVKDVVRQLSPADFLAVRFVLAAALMTVVFWRPLRALNRRQVLLGAALGAVYAVAQLLQTVGLAHTEASRSGFITGTYVVMTPLLSAALLRDRVPRTTWVAVGLSAVGLAALSLRGAGSSGPGPGLGFGEAVTLASAAVYALQIIGLGRWSSASAAAGLSAMQMIVIAAVCVVAAAPGGIDLPAGAGAWSAVVYMALVAGALAIWGQTWAQSHMPATRAAIVMTLEPVFAAGFAVALGGEVLTPRMLLGGAAVLAAMYVVELPGRRRGATAAEDPPSELLHHEV
jgi:drug/metabolite transporter (DMT)-like permease